MSAFLCSDKHIATMAKYVASLHGSINPQELANKIKRINLESVNYRYNEKTRFSKCNMENLQEIGANDFAVLFDCWDYQSSENPQSTDYQIMRGFLKFFADKGNSNFSSIRWDI